MTMCSITAASIVVRGREFILGGEVGDAVVGPVSTEQLNRWGIDDVLIDVDPHDIGCECFYEDLALQIFGEVIGVDFIAVGVSSDGRVLLKVTCV
jgi:hypothetical protein